MAMTKEQRRQRARIAALARWAKEQPHANAVRGQAGLVAKFRRQIDAEHPDLPPAELERRVDCARRAHMARLSLASSKRATRANSTTPPGTPPPSPPPPQPPNPGHPRSTVPASQALGGA